MKLFTLRPSQSEFERQVLPHLDGAYRLALWLVRDPANAEDLVQDAVLKAHSAWGRYTAGNTRAWLFTIVRRCCYDWLRQGRHATVDVDDETTWTTEDAVHLRDEDTPETSLVAAEMVERLREALLTLPAVFREVIMLKDIEDMPYKTIAEVLGVPVGTVMSRLARGRDMLRVRLVEVQS